MEFYAIIYTEIVLIICLSPVIAAIFRLRSFEMIVLSIPVLSILVIILGFIIYSIKYISDAFGL
jgi:hypothetical protein